MMLFIDKDTAGAIWFPKKPGGLFCRFNLFYHEMEWKGLTAIEKSGKNKIVLWKA